MPRVQKSAIPDTLCRCPKMYCVYNKAGLCDEPRTNNGNSDAACFNMNNKDVVAMLTVSLYD